MLHQACFRFYAELNDFLPAERRFRTLTYFFNGHPAVKDAIEAFGIPHTEIDLILINNQSVNFETWVASGDRIAVYPVFELFDISGVSRLREHTLREPVFILDVNLGKLTRFLRMAGFDSIYQNNFTDFEIIDLALQEGRIILTRDQGILKNGRVTHGYWIRSVDPEVQFKEVLNKFDLFSRMHPFLICLDCNGKIVSVDKPVIEQNLLPDTRQFYNTFFRCCNCGKIYWRGSHYSRMLRFLESVCSDNNTNLPAVLPFAE
jgi:uncharacterized protein with PIN domain